MLITVDNFALRRWRALDAALVLSKVADYAKADATYTPVKNRSSSRWHVTCRGTDFELLLTGPKFWDIRGQVGGGGAVDLLMHLEKRSFKGAVARLVSLGL